MERKIHIKMLTGVLYQIEVVLRINGLTPQKHRTAVNKQIGVCSDKNHIYVTGYSCAGIFYFACENL